MSRKEMQRSEIAEELDHLIEVSSSLREAMLSRNAERILELVERAESWAPSLALQTAAPDVLEDERVSERARTLRRLQESNRLLSNAFVKLYRSVLQSTKESIQGATGLYGRAGRTETGMAGPMLINQTG